IGLPAEEAIEPRQFVGSPQRSAVALIKFADLFDGEIFQSKARADVEGRLIQVGNEQMCLRRIGDGERQARPGAGGIERTAVMPGAEQAEDFAAEVAGKEAVYLIESPYN